VFSKNLTALVFGAALAVSPAFAQEEGAVSKHEFAVQALGSFTKTTTSNGIDQSATNSGGVLGSYRYFFNRNHGVEVNYGWSPNTQKYGGAGVSNYTNEVTADYVFRLPRKHWTPFVLAGVGALVFDPRDFALASSQARAAFVYGGGADFTLTQHIFMRAEYRGFVYNSPTYDLPGLQGFDRITHNAVPSVGFGYRF